MGRVLLGARPRAAALAPLPRSCSHSHHGEACGLSVPSTGKLMMRFATVPRMLGRQRLGVRDRGLH